VRCYCDQTYVTLAVEGWVEYGVGDTLHVGRRNREFLALLGQHELKLAACIHALVPSWQDAEDILQETRIQLWQEFETFRPGSDFLAWARTVARYLVRTHVRRSQRKPLVLSSEVQDLILSRLAVAPAQPDRRLEMLSECVKRLSEDALALLRRCYVDKQKIKDIAVEAGRSLTGTYSALSRIRRELFDCVQEHLRAEDDR
jgi:RNA polymerase sigma-70 factor, ECF subfamily